MQDQDSLIHDDDTTLAEEIAVEELAVREEYAACYTEGTK
jgi:hypothetical protein